MHNKAAQILGPQDSPCSGRLHRKAAGAVISDDAAGTTLRHRRGCHPWPRCADGRQLVLRRFHKIKDAGGSSGGTQSGGVRRWRRQYRKLPGLTGAADTQTPARRSMSDGIRRRASLDIACFARLSMLPIHIWGYYDRQLMLGPAIGASAPAIRQRRAPAMRLYAARWSIFAQFAFQRLSCRSERLRTRRPAGFRTDDFTQSEETFDDRAAQPIDVHGVAHLARGAGRSHHVGAKI